MRAPAFVKRWFGSLPVWQSPSWRAVSALPLRMGTSKQRLASQDEAEGLTAVFRSCAILADTLASLPLSLVKRPAAGGREQVFDADVSRAVSDLTYEQKEGFFYSAALTGNGYFLKQRNDRGGLDGLQWIPAWRVSIETDGGRVMYRLAEDTVLGVPEDLVPADDMVHLRYRLTGKNDLYGVSPVYTLSPSLAVCLQTREAQESAFRNVASPGVYLHSPNKLGPDAAKRLKEQWTEGVGGENKGGTPVLDNGMDVGAMPLAELQNMQLAELARFNVSEVSRAFGIPLSLLAEVSSVNYSTASEETRSLVSMTIKPWAARAESCLNHSLLNRQQRTGGLGFAFDLQGLLIGSGAERIEYYSKGLNGGILTLDEARNELGYGDVTGGDEIRVPVNTTPVEHWLKGPQKAAGAVSTLAATEPKLRANRQLMRLKQVIQNAK